MLAVVHLELVILAELIEPNRPPNSTSTTNLYYDLPAAEVEAILWVTAKAKRQMREIIMTLLGEDLKQCFRGKADERNE